MIVQSEEHPVNEVRGIALLNTAVRLPREREEHTARPEGLNLLIDAPAQVTAFDVDDFHPLILVRFQPLVIHRAKAEDLVEQRCQAPGMRSARGRFNRLGTRDNPPRRPQGVATPLPQLHASAGATLITSVATASVMCNIYRRQCVKDRPRENRYTWC